MSAQRFFSSQKIVRASKRPSERVSRILSLWNREVFVAQRHDKKRTDVKRSCKRQSRRRLGAVLESLSPVHCDRNQVTPDPARAASRIAFDSRLTGVASPAGSVSKGN